MYLFSFSLFISRTETERERGGGDRETGTERESVCVCVTDGGRERELTWLRQHKPTYSRLYYFTGKTSKLYVNTRKSNWFTTNHVAVTEAEFYTSDWVHFEYKVRWSLKHLVQHDAESNTFSTM